jgi:PEGA domain
MPLFAKLLVAVALLANLPLPAQSTRPRKSDDRKGPSCNEPPDKPFTLAAVAFLLTTPSKACTTEYVQKRGVTFQADPIIIEALKTLGASDELIAAIPAPPPPAPPVPTSGALTILCQPDRCDVLVNDHDYGVAEDGKKVITELPAGTAQIQVRAEGFEPAISSVELTAGEPRQVPFRLKPSSASRREQGRTLLLKVIAAFGGMDGLATLSEISDDGTAALPDIWEMSFKGRWGSVSLVLRSAQGECLASISTGMPTAECKGKLKQSKQEPAMAKVAALFRDSALPLILGRMATREVTEDDSQGRKIKTENEEDSYVLALDTSGLPEEVIFRPKAGEPLRIRYAKYVMKDGLPYPGEVEVSEVSADKPFVVFNFTSVPKPLPGPAAKKGR